MADLSDAMLTLWIVVCAGLVLVVLWAFGGVLLTMHASRQCQQAGYGDGFATTSYELRCTLEPIRPPKSIPLSEVKTQGGGR